MTPETTERIYFSPRTRAVIIWAGIALALLFLWRIGSILSPFIWAIVTAYVLNPVALFLSKRLRMPRRLAAGFVFLVLLGLLAWGLGTLLPVLSQEFQEFNQALPEHFRAAGNLIGAKQIELLGVTINLESTDAEIRRQVGQLVGQLGRDILPSAITRVADSLLKILVYLVASFFLLMGAEQIVASISGFASPGARAELGPWVRRINHVLGAYIRGQLILVVLMSTASYIALQLLQVRFAPLLAIFTGIMETIPFVGPYTAGATAVLLAVTQGSAPYGWSPIVLGIAVAVTYTVLRQLEDNFVMPFLIGRLVHLHPLLVIFVVLAGASVAGIMGLLLAVPVAATIKIIATYLLNKLREEPPRTLAIIEPDDDWDSITDHIRDAQLISKAAGASKPRLLVSVPSPPPWLLDPTQFHRLPALLDELDTDAVVITTNADLQQLAESAGISTKLEPEWQAAPPPEPDFEEVAARRSILSAGRLRVRHKGGTTKQSGKDIPA